MVYPDDIYAYLHFGYLPAPKIDLFMLLGEFSRDDNWWKASNLQDKALLVEKGANVLQKAFRESMVETNRLNILPLSGGLDSRAILGGLLENVDRGRIQTVTFGSPGTWDYEIGRMVADRIGVSNERIDLSSTVWKWDMEGLIRTAAEKERPIWLFDAYVNRQIAEHFGRDCVYWSGFMGDPLAGSHLLAQDSISWEQARSRFVLRNQFCRSLRLTPSEFNPAVYLPDSPPVSSDLLGYDEQIDFGIRQNYWIRNIVLPRGYDYRTTFLHSDWVRFILSVPREERQGQRLYKIILKKVYPELFSLPTKANLGLPLDCPRYRLVMQKLTVKSSGFIKRLFRLQGVCPLTNYIDFDRGLRERADLKIVVYENILDLKKRGIVDWIDVEELWTLHQQKRGNFADALTLLASLEINLKAGH